MLCLVTVFFLSSHTLYQVSFKKKKERKRERDNKSCILKSLPLSTKGFPPMYALKSIPLGTLKYKTVVGQNNENSFGSNFPNFPS